MPTSEKVLGAVQTARPVVERLARDDEFQQSVKTAYESARHIYDELFTDSSPKAMAGRLAGDKSLQDELRRAVEALSDAKRRATTPPEKSHTGRNVLLLTGIVVGLLYNPITGPSIRQWLKDKAFGPEETFDYEPSSLVSPAHPSQGPDPAQRTARRRFPPAGRKRPRFSERSTPCAALESSSLSSSLPERSSRAVAAVRPSSTVRTSPTGP